MRSHIIAILMTFIFSAGITSNAAPRPTVIELFTSQGCSSCPPADALLSELSSRPDVLALAFHVDYWDSLGWHDRFALPLSTQRQQRYASALRLGNIFTPQLIIDGQLSRVGSNRSSILGVVKQPRSGIPVHTSVINSRLHVQLDGAPDTPYDVLIVAYLPQSLTSIGRGENAGRKLKETNIVRDLRVLGRWDADNNRFSMDMTSLSTEATRAAVLLQQPDQGPIVGATIISLR